MNSKKVEKRWLHWVLKDHICKWCGQNLLSPNTTSDCPSRPKNNRMA